MQEPGKRTLASVNSDVSASPDAPLQLRSAHASGGPERDGGSDTTDVHSLARRGSSGGTARLQYFDVIQRSFGHHDLSGLVAHLDGEVAQEMGAEAFTFGRHVVLGAGASLSTEAHEAAHYIEQLHGKVQLASGIGAEGDIYEQHANEVAALVVAGKSAEALLDEYVGHQSGTGNLVAAAAGPVQRKPSDLSVAAAGQVPKKLDNARGFERKLGVAAFGDRRAQDAATATVDRMVAAVLPGFDELNADHQQSYSDLFGRDNLGDNNPDRANGAWSAGQVGKDFATLRAALTTGNLREKMTGVYNASLGGFKQEVLTLMNQDRATIEGRGLDATKLARRRNQLKFNPGAKDLYRDPGNPIDRKKFSSYEVTGQTRTAAVGDAQESQRTVGELDHDAIGLSDREKEFMYGNTAVPDATLVKWKEGGTYWNVNNDNKWVKKYQEKLLMPVVAGPSGTALRMFQAWEYLNKPASNVDFRLALLGWMLTGNDHSFHEIMATSADYGLPYTPGLDAYRRVAPYDEAALRAIAAPEGFPDEENYRTDHVTTAAAIPGMDPRIKTDPQVSVLTTPAQAATFDQLLKSAAFPGIDGGQLAQAMALLVYTDDRNSGPEGVSAFEFINHVLKGHDNVFAMYYFIRKDPRLKAAYDANRFQIRELVAEAKEHAKQAQEGLKLRPVFNGQVFRGYKTNTLPTLGQSWNEQKFLSMSKDRGVSEGFALDPAAKGKYSILVTMDSTRGRDLGDVSMFGAGESEVLYAPGSGFSVAAAPTPWPGVDNGLLVQWQEA
jgi:hypothetical protein